MTETDFTTWLTYHVAAFPNLADWFRKLPNMADTKNHWKRVVSALELDEAKHATDQMVEDETLVPRSHSGHPGRIRRLAAEARPDHGAQRDARQYVGGELVCDCKLCRDTGYVSVWHVITVLDILRGRPLDWPRDKNGHICNENGEPVRGWRLPESQQAVRKMSMVVRCSCLRGESVRMRVPVYDPDKHVIEDGSNASFELLVERAEEVARNYNGMARDMPNYEPAFADWSKE